MIPNLTNQEACKLALKHRLFVSGWMLSSFLRAGATESYGSPQFAAVFMDNGIPVAVAVVTKQTDIQVFVRKSLRRKGIGSALVSHMKKLMGDRAKHMDAGTGLISGSREFWNANKIPMYD